jgi:hypothetical protein
MIIMQGVFGLVKIFNKKCIIIRQRVDIFPQFKHIHNELMRFILNLENLMCSKTLILGN